MRIIEKICLLFIFIVEKVDKLTNDLFEMTSELFICQIHVESTIHLLFSQQNRQ